MKEEKKAVDRNSGSCFKIVGYVQGQGVDEV
jgi:hypothetical protein